MSKNTDTVIRSLDASTIYYKGRPERQIQEYLAIKEAYYEQKKRVKNMSGSEPDFERQVKIKMELEEKQKSYMEDTLLHIGVENDFKMSKCSSKTTDSTSNMSLSLMREELQSILKKKDKFTRDEKCSYSDVVINVTFNSDVFGTTDKYIKNEQGEWVKHGRSQATVINATKLRKIIYKYGFWINGRHYVDYQRSGAKSRIGNDLFIIEDYLDHMKKWMDLGLDFNIPKDNTEPGAKVEYEKVDLVAVRSYQSLASSSIIGTIDIDPESVLLVDDVVGCYTMDCNVIRNQYYEDEQGKTKRMLGVERENYTKFTDCTDGESLVDESIFDENTYWHRTKDGAEEKSYSGKGFLLLRNRYFKSAGFNTRLQAFFQSDVAKKYLTERTDPETGEIYYTTKDRFGDEYDTRKIKVVTTKNSVKIFKEPFKSAIIRGQLGYTKEQMKEMSNKECEHLIWTWYKGAINSTFGICKYEKVSKFNDGEWQQSAYQINNSLNFSKEDIANICSPMFNEMHLLKNHVAFMKEHLHNSRTYRDAMMSELLEINSDIAKTNLYDDYLKTQLQSIRNKLYKGKALIENSDYAVLFGNPYEFLLQAVGGLETKEVVGADGKKNKVAVSITDNEEHDKARQFEVYCKKFADKKELYCFRNPHIMEANSAYLINQWHDEYQWFNFTENIIAVSFTGYGAFLGETLQGADVDSDSVLVGDNPIILRKVKQAKQDPEKLVAINDIEQEPVNRLYTEESLAEVDAKLSNDFIGRIVNLAQVIQSCYWHIYNSGTEEQKKLLPQIYEDISILSVLSGVAIDSAKRRYAVSIQKELNRIQHREYLTKVGAVIEGIAIAEEIKVEKPSIKESAIKRLEEHRAVLEDEKSTPEMIESANEKIEEILYKKVYVVKKPLFMSKLKDQPKKKVNKNAPEIEQWEQKRYAENDKIRQENSYVRFDTPMDFMVDLVSKYRVKSEQKPREKETVDIIDVLKPIPKGEKAQSYVMNNIITWTLEFLKQQKVARLTAKSKEEADSKVNAINDNAINKFKKYKVTENEIITLIKKGYDDHIKVRSTETVKKIDERLTENKAKAKMISWLYEAHRETFLNAFRQSIDVGTQEYLKEVPADYKLQNGQTVYTLYSKNYLIVKREPKQKKAS